MKGPYLFPGWRRAESYRFFILAGVAALLVLSVAFTQLLASAAGVREETLRLHILANSDSPRDQWIKLQVRDSILEQVGQFLATAQNREEAVELVQLSLPRIQVAADKALARTGSGQRAEISLEEYRFSTTRYEGFTLPAGEYLALRITLGKGQGHNWFCCLYPALCLDASGAEYAAPEKNELVFGDYLVRFAAIELWEELWN